MHKDVRAASKIQFYSCTIDRRESLISYIVISKDIRVKEVATNVTILAVRSSSRRSVRSLSLCILPVFSTVDRRAYSSVAMVQRHLRKKSDAA